MSNGFSCQFDITKFSGLEGAHRLVVFPGLEIPPIGFVELTTSSFLLELHPLIPNPVKVKSKTPNEVYS